MKGYWVRHRLIYSVVICVAVSLIVSFLFAYPPILQEARNYNTQSIYKNSKIDFIAPEPSFEQIYELPGKHGIYEVFPFFLTKTIVRVNEKTRTTTVLLSDQFQNIGFTMYSDARLIEKSSTEYENSILVDWQFCKDTSASLGDSVYFEIGGKDTEFKIYAIYETNSIYDGGALLARINAEQKATIAQQSMNNGYSGMYVSASDYNTCRAFLTTEFRPLGRLKDRNQFDSDEQYRVHYDAIMSSGYANEITDFRIRENSLSINYSQMLCYVGAVLSAIALIWFNVAMARRGCEKVYFTKQCVPKGQDIKPYYRTAFVFEMLLTLALFAALLVLRIKLSDTFFSKSTIGISVVVVPVAIVISELICLCMNNAKASGLVKNARLEKQRSNDQNTQ